MSQQEEYQAPEGEKGGVYLEAINQTLTREEMTQLAQELPSRIAKIKEDTALAEHRLKGGTVSKLLDRLGLGDFNFDRTKNEDYLSAFKETLARLEAVQKEILGKTQKPKA